MERSEPSLVPEWLKSSGSLTGSGTSAHPLSSSSVHSEDQLASKLARNKPSANSNDHELGRSSVSDRTSSSYFRRSSSSNGSAHLRSYSSFGRNNRGRDWDKDIYESRDKDRSVFGDHKHRDYLDPPGNIFPGRFEKDGLRRSQSMISGKRGEVGPKKSSADSITAPRNNAEVNDVLSKGSSTGSMQKVSFEKDFPSLVSEERQAAPDIARVPSPSSSTAIHGLPISTSAVIVGDKRVSALAEVPGMVGNSTTGTSSAQQASLSGIASPALTTATGLNMAEAVAQGPPRTQIAPQLSTGTQRGEELAIKKIIQLIPVTPSMHKPSVLNSSDKVKAKVGQLQHPTPSLSPSLRGGPVKTDVSKTSTAGKLHVLKPARERNGVSPATKDSLSPTNSGKRANSPVAVAPSAIGLSTSRAVTSNPASPSSERKHVLTMLEKRPTSQAQSRNDFFNLVRKKSMANSSSNADPSPGLTVSSSVLSKPGEEDVAPAPATPLGRDDQLLDSPNGCQSAENEGNLSCNGDAFDGERDLKNGKNRSSSYPIISEEEEAKFLRLLGWEENSDEDGLTEEEINAYYRDVVTKYMNSKPSLKILQRVQPRFSLPLSSQVNTVGAVSSGVSTSDSKLEA